MICDFRLQIAELNPCLRQAGEIRHDTGGVGTTVVPTRTDRIPKSALELNISLSVRIVKDFRRELWKMLFLS
jgi:hypothetical protein